MCWYHHTLKFSSSLSILRKKIIGMRIALDVNPSIVERYRTRERKKCTKVQLIFSWRIIKSFAFPMYRLTISWKKLLFLSLAVCVFYKAYTNRRRNETDVFKINQPNTAMIWIKVQTLNGMFSLINKHMCEEKSSEEKHKRIEIKVLKPFECYFLSIEMK